MEGAEAMEVVSAFYALSISKNHLRDGSDRLLVRTVEGYSHSRQAVSGG